MSSNPGSALIALIERYRHDASELKRIEIALAAFDRLSPDAVFYVTLSGDDKGVSFQKTNDDPLGQWPLAYIDKSTARAAYARRAAELSDRVHVARLSIETAEATFTGPCRL